jgi:hypothetical protein
MHRLNALGDDPAGASAAEAGWPRWRLAKMPRRISRQPSQVLTIVPSVWNSMSPAPAAKPAPAAGSVCSQSARSPASS